MNNVFGYCRISRRSQDIKKQAQSIRDAYPDAVIIIEKTPGDRREWDNLEKSLKSGDVIVFESVSRMAGSADEGLKLYLKLVEQGIELIFLKEHFIDTATYKKAFRSENSRTDNERELDERERKILHRLMEYQVYHAIMQAKKEDETLSMRRREGIERARKSGKTIGGVSGRKLITKKSIECKKKIRKYCRDFDGAMSDLDVMRHIGISRNTYYKYKKEMKKEG